LPLRSLNIAWEVTLDRKTALSINRRLLNHYISGTTDVAPGEFSVGTDVFTDPKLAELERAKLFHAKPQPVAFSGEIPDPGCYLTLNILDVPVLLVRDDHGRLFAFINSCMHRGAQVARGSGKAPSLVCAFHGWSYKHDGTLKGRPEADMFATRPEDCSLARLAVAEKHGIVVVGCSADTSQRAVDSALDEIGLELECLKLREYKLIERRRFEVAANWKLINDLSLESYHFKTLHRESVAKILAPNAVVDTFGRHSRWAFPMKSIARLEQLKESEWPDSVEGSVTYTLYPGVMLLVNASGAQIIRSEPSHSPGSSVVTYVGMYAPHGSFDGACEAFRFGGDVFADEDLPVAAECQRGIEARGGRYLLGANEPLLQFWHKLWDCRSDE
jgi:phenylpropionate dioxygenase-like ring-hydroxylating dioxygenase large terminal subunit